MMDVVLTAHVEAIFQSINVDHLKDGERFALFMHLAERELDALLASQNVSIH